MAQWACVRTMPLEIVSLAASCASKLALWDRLPCRSQHFCDVSLRSADGQVFKAHRLVLSMASDPLFAMLSGSFAEGHQSEVLFESSSEALKALLDFMYGGAAQVRKSVLPELLRLVHQWEVHPLLAALTELVMEHMTPELCSCLIVDCEVLLVDRLAEMLECYVLENFAACVKTAKFESWPLHRMISLLQNDDLLVENEEEVLSAVMHWHRCAPGREHATAALLQVVRFPLLSMASLQALQRREGLPGLPGVVMTRLATQAMKSHMSTPNGACRANTIHRPPLRRTAFPCWWADFGCSLKGGTVVAERPRDAAEGELDPWAVIAHNDSLFIVDGNEACCVLQWPLRSSAGRVIVGAGSTLNGVNEFSEIIDIAIDEATGDLYVLDGQHGRIVKIHDGAGEVVGEGTLALEGTRALYISTDGAIYFIDERGSRVRKYLNGKISVVAGSSDPGSTAGQLEDAEDIFVTRDGTLYISDSGNHRIQKWEPGANAGMTVAGGNGKGSREDQLFHPVGLYVTEEGIIYVADYQNHRVMKWKEGWSSGLVVAGGYDAGSALHQLCEPIDVTLDASNSLYVADNGNSRVICWKAPCPPYEQILSPPF